jgi:hypothetical protein
VFASRPASIRTLIELLSSVPDGVPRFGWGAAISATASTRPRRRTQSVPYRRLCSTVPGSCSSPHVHQSNSVSFPISISVDRPRRAGHLGCCGAVIHPPEIHNRCSSMASLRATATTARFFAFFHPAADAQAKSPQVATAPRPRACNARSSPGSCADTVAGFVMPICGFRPGVVLLGRSPRNYHCPALVECSDSDRACTPAPCGLPLHLVQ